MELYLFYITFFISVKTEYRFILLYRKNKKKLYIFYIFLDFIIYIVIQLWIDYFYIFIIFFILNILIYIF